ncbi:hypothetical protein BFP72_08475 [Reichenbachiella sp. 5M10]|uniref:hypothetical protein n=1 Tax=Reichenbachiella sp. 5M10 TaxID=1889772 RepID=UPI000C15194D|nr:hypothetical protein [Reichenbachiella sp. 5M10]PIB35427.1 hypothetical protein BFP72_08475 [Reichenbachiella sp. 5M10]
MKPLQSYLFVLCLSISFSTLAQTDSLQTLSVEEMAKKRQDPVAGLRSVYLQEVLLPVGEGVAQSFSVQPVWPFKIAKNIKLITYTIIPFQGIPAVGGVSHVPLVSVSSSGDATARASGLGNILFNGYFSSIEKKGQVSWGIGPAIQLPTRTNAALGSNRVSMGPSFLLNHGGDKFSGGFVVQNYWSLGGEGVNQVNSFNFQYFTYYNLPKGWFIESNATVINNWRADEGEQLLLPVGGGGGKTFQIGKSGLFYCATAQLFYNAVRPSIVGNWEAIVQFQVIF